MRNPGSTGTGSGMVIRSALVSWLRFLVLAFLVCSSDASRGLRLSLRGGGQVDASPGTIHEQQLGTEPAVQQLLLLPEHTLRRLLAGAEATLNTGDFEEISECNLENLHECAPPALGSQFPTFESKKEVPNGPNPLHN
ncbi:protein MpCLE2 [Marchantia polymorpha subsp. ruderalis]|uniref:Uncharacterized protein n=2 Tax=Marchantia polymorpha TaxID=3197 RepID=A0AAF6BJK0_MARPO|nr:hypothetical protein MARPO_0084s0052 [Marchantia polymorpha]BBN12184.1 hypothetical protein Mp_5g18050 [Marchantia polymorpha subsp. ruderalis]|eukprot:PTQ33970.1 hypothetical protein MARPO_0084s0052 [Marchantia polymorpha]